MAIADALINLDGRFLDDLFAVIETATGGMTVRLMPTGQMLLNALTGIAMTWFGIQWALGDDQEDAMRDLVRIILIWGIAAWFLREFDYLTGAIVSGFDEAAAIVAGVGDYKDMSGSVTRALGTFGEAIMVIWERITKAAYVEGWGINVQSVFVGIIYLILIGMLVLAGILFARAYIISIIVTDIALAIAPIMIPWIMLQQTRFIFEGWMRYLVVAGMYRVVGAVLVTLSSQLIPTLVSIRTATRDDGILELDFYSLFMMLLFTSVVIWLMHHIPQIANGLVGGSVIIAQRREGAKAPDKKPNKPDK